MTEDVHGVPTFLGFLGGSRPRRTAHGVHRTPDREPRSLTDARARVDESALPPANPRQEFEIAGVPAALLGADAVSLISAAVIAGVSTMVALLFAATVIVIRAGLRLYRVRLHLSVLDELPRALGSVLAAGGLLLLVLSVSARATGLPRELIVFVGTFTLLSFVLHTAALESQVVDTVITAHQSGCSVLIVPRMFELHHDGPDVERIRGVPLIRLRPDPTLRPTWWVKRVVDIGVGVLGLLVTAPLLLVLAVAVVLESGRPVLFWQERVGLDGKLFRLCKFRSMRPRDEAESQTNWSIARDPRVGPVGRFLRRSSLDELAQLWNIARGDMSLVGPRPERPTFVRRFSDEHERYWARHRVPVGLTGLSQVNGLRGDTSIRERARYDNYYIANWTLWLDVKILLLTAREVLRGGGGR